MTTTPKQKPSIIWFSSREIGVTAAFGGLGFVSVALGLVIPLLPGGGSVFALQGLSPISSIAAGPIAGFIVEALTGTPRPFYLVNWVLSLSCFPYAFAMVPVRNKPRYIQLPYAILMDYLINDAFWLALSGSFFLSFVYGIVPGWAGFWSLFWLMQTVFVPATVIINAIYLVIAYTMFPNFMKMSWWDRWMQGRKAIKEWAASQK